MDNSTPNGVPRFVSPNSKDKTVITAKTMSRITNGLALSNFSIFDVKNKYLIYAIYVHYSTYRNK